MARNKFDVDERLETPFQWRHLKRAGAYIGKHKYKMILALLLSAMASVAALFIPKITQWVLDDAVPNKDIAMIGRMAGLFVGIILLSIVFTTIRSRLMAHVSQEIIYDIRRDLFAHLQRLPFSYYDSRPAGKILVRVINYVNSVSDILSNGIINMILEIINLIFIVIFMFSTNAELAAIILAGLPFFIAIILILLAVSVFLISNTVTIGISVRKEEIGIMKLIGATNLFVRAPFLIEGILIGLVGAAIPLGLLYVVYNRVISYVMTEFSVLSNFMAFMPVSAVFRILLPVGLILGMGIGLVGSIFTIRKHLKV